MERVYSETSLFADKETELELSLTSTGRLAWVDLEANGDDTVTIFVDDMSRENIDRFAASLRSVAIELESWNTKRKDSTE